jgi:hypothetical protein
MAAKTAAAEEIVVTGSRIAQASRAAYNASPSAIMTITGDKDLVADVASGRVDLASVPEAELPASIAALPPAEQDAKLKETAALREGLQNEIAKLVEQRDAFIATKVEEAGGAAGSLDQQIYDAVREQAAPLGLEYEDGPRF